MKGKSLIAKNRETAFRVWRECGQNVELTIRTLKDEHDLPLSKPTLYDWMEKFNWKERAAKADTEEQKANDVILNEEEKLIGALVSQKERYEKYFESLKEMETDNQAVYAYTNLVKTILEIRAKAASYKSMLFVDFLRDMIEYLAKHDPGSVSAIERNFDEFIAYAKEKYAA